MKIKKLNLTDLDIKINDDNIIPKNIGLSETDIKDFNNRQFHPNNINKIIELCIYLNMNNISEFILKNTQPTEEPYVLTTENKEIVKLPKFMYDSSYSQNKNNYYFRTNNYKPKYYDLCVRSIENNLVKWLDWGCKNNYGWFNGQIIEHLCNIAAINNSLESLKYLYENFNDKQLWGTTTTRYAASYGNIDILKYLHKNGCPWDWKTCKYAVETDCLECLEYAHKNGCLWNEDVMNTAIQYGSINCIKYLDLNNCPTEYNSVIVAARFGKVEVLKYIVSRNLFVEKDLAAKILFENDKTDFEEKYLKPMLISIAKKSIEKGHLDCLKEIYDNFDIDLNISTKLLLNVRDIELLDYLNKHDLINDDALSYQLSSSCSKDFEYIVYYVDNKLPGYEKFLSESFVNKINKRLNWGNNNFDIFLKSKYFKEKIKSITC